MPPVIEPGGLNGVDIAILAIVLISTGMSLLSGFFKEAISLVTWVAAFWVAVNFSTQQAALLESLIATPSLRMAASLGILFIATLILGSLVNRLMQELVSFSGLGSFDHLLGGLFGALRGVLIVSLLAMGVEMTPMVHDRWWQDSTLLPHLREVTALLLELIPEDLKTGAWGGLAR